MLNKKSAEPAEPRNREISWDAIPLASTPCSAETIKDLTVLEVCGYKILLGWNSGEIKIYNSLDLRCETTLEYPEGVSCLQCTCTEIIAGYGGGSICVWNIQSGLRTQKFWLDKLGKKRERM